MISTRRIVAAVGLAVGVTGLAAPMASAAAPQAPDAGRLNPITELDTLATSGLPAEHRGDIPRISNQLAGLNHLNDVNQLHQLTDLAAPVTGLLPGIEA
ncbi:MULTISPECIES: hypothetical protein [unclassified Streptomyces]|uniref:hypothetical protein n=1 Tax=unclassified Streptomyces TaxID=2593676 RepID=UPI0011CE9D9C|nr:MULTISPECIES: hypothetical protein [unclassified Streptomyces]TXS71286.1 hypothetical protein EAO69_23375 [Streptomyces sp. me109]